MAKTSLKVKQQRKPNIQLAHIQDADFAEDLMLY